MHYTVGGYFLSFPEESDLDQLYLQKNDPEINRLLGGYAYGYSRADMREWLEFHRKRKDEWLLAIRDKETGRCIGHVGLYKIDFRVRSCEFGIMIGDKTRWGQGLGRLFTQFVIDHAFREFNMNRVALSLLADNKRAEALYKSLNFRLEGVLRQVLFKDGRYFDMILMSILRSEYYAKSE